MSRRKRTSRALIALLVCTIVIGGVFYSHNLSKGKAAEKPPEPVKPVLASPVAAPATANQSAPAALGNQQEARPALPADRAVPTQISTAANRVVLAQAPATQPIQQHATVAMRTNAPSADPATVLTTAKQQISSGKAVSARSALNDLLTSGQLNAADEKAVKQQLAEINEQVVYARKAFPDDTYTELYTVKSGESLAKIANRCNVPWELLCTINGISDPKKLRAGQTIKIVKGPIHAVVDKTEFTLDLYLNSPGGAGSLYLMSLPVGLGRDDSTPTGTWQVAKDSKLRNPKFWGAGDLPPMEADDPQNPLGEYWLGLVGIEGQAIGKESYGIHGTIDPNSIGKQASMGCIRLRDADIKRVYESLIEQKSTVVVRE